MCGDDDKEGWFQSRSRSPSTHTHTTPTPNPLDGGPAPLTVIVSFFGPSMTTPSCHLFCPPTTKRCFFFRATSGGERQREVSPVHPAPNEEKMRKRTSETTGERVTPAEPRQRPDTCPSSHHEGRSTTIKHNTEPPAFREPPKPACVQLPLRPLSGTSRSLSSVHARCPANLCPFGTIALNGLNRCLWNPRSRHTMRGASANNLSLSARSHPPLPPFLLRAEPARSQC